MYSICYHTSCLVCFMLVISVSIIVFLYHSLIIELIREGRLIESVSIIKKGHCKAFMKVPDCEASVSSPVREVVYGTSLVLYRSVLVRLVNMVVLVNCTLILLKHRHHTR